MIQELEDKLIALLKAGVPNAEVLAFPDEWETSGKPQSRNLVYVAFSSITRNEPETLRALSNAPFAMLSILQFELQIHATSLRTTNRAGAYALVESCINALQGNKLADNMGLLHVAGFEAIGRTDAKQWVFRGTLQVGYKEMVIPQ